jgi:hypothetical protein
VTTALAPASRSSLASASTRSRAAGSSMPPRGARMTTTSVTSRSRSVRSCGNARSRSSVARLDSVSLVISTSAVSTSPRNIPRIGKDATTTTTQIAMTRPGRLPHARASRSVIGAAYSSHWPSA